jgi:hypothetical protein
MLEFGQVTLFFIPRFKVNEATQPPATDPNLPKAGN